MSFVDNKKKLIDHIYKLYSAPAKLCVDIPESYREIQLLAERRELVNEKYKILPLLLNSTLSEAKFTSEFKKLTAAREKQNIHSYLSYSAYPHSLCNLMYWDAIIILYAPKTMGQLLKILFPDLQGVLQVDFHVENREEGYPNKRRRLNRNSIALKLTTESLDSLDMECNIDILKSFVMGDNYLFSLKSIEKLSFKFHQQLYVLLAQRYPRLKQKFYRVNADMRKLHDDLEQIKNNGKTLRQALEILITDLTSSGQKYTGSIFALDRANDTSDEFRAYFKKIPKVTRQEMLSLADANQNISLADVMEDLRTGECCQETAEGITHILANPANTATLEKGSLLTPEQIAAIVDYYDAHTLSTEGLDSAQKIPTALHIIFKSIEFTHVDNYSHLLMYIPTEDFAPIIEHAKIRLKPALPATFAIEFHSFALTARRAFFQAIIKHAAKFDLLELLCFTARAGEVAQLKEVLNLFDGEKSTLSREGALMYISPKGNTMLHIAVENEDPAVLMTLLEYLNDYLTDEEQYDFVNTIGIGGLTVLDLAYAKEYAYLDKLEAFIEKIEPESVWVYSENSPTFFSQQSYAVSDTQEDEYILVPGSPVV